MIASVGRKKRGRKLRTRKRCELAAADFEPSPADVLLSNFSVSLMAMCHTPGAFTQHLLEGLEREKREGGAPERVRDYLQKSADFAGEPPSPRLRLVVDNE